WNWEPGTWNFAMTTRAQLIGLVRNELGDVGAAKLWADALLQQWLAEAISEYGERLPREALTTWASVAGQAGYALPPDFVRALRVEHPAGTFRAYAPAAGGDALDDVSVEGGARHAAPPLTYDVSGGRLGLDPAPP